MSELSIEEWAVLWRMADLTHEWRRNGHMGMCSQHHFSDLFSKRDTTPILNGLIPKGFVRAGRHGRYKVWLLV